MKRYNVEVFDRFEYRSSVQLEKVEFKEDYLSPEKNKVKTGQKQFCAEKDDYIHIIGPDMETLGIVTQVQVTKEETQVTYEQFVTQFDLDIYCNPEELETVTIENFMAKLIRQYFVENEDELQNIEGMEVQVMSGTAGTLQIEGNIVNLLSDIIIPAFESYQIVVNPVWDIPRKRITLNIERCSSEGLVIEADLPNILDKNIVLRKTRNDLNKIVVINEENAEESVTVYRTSENQITTDTANRIEPVKVAYMLAKASGNKSFSEAAYEKAENKLKKAAYENLIELEIKCQDALVRPDELVIGQSVQIISDGISHYSILTGRQIKDTETLIFGTIRLDLTKVIRRM